MARLPDGRRKHGLAERLEQVLSHDFVGHLLAFDADAAPYYAQIASTREALGLPISMADAQIAAICRTWDADLATRNVRDFNDTGVRTADPWVE